MTPVDTALPGRREPGSIPVDRLTGLLALPPGTERYPVKGGGAIVVALSAGDEITITDIEGRQKCELAVFDRQGREDPAAIGERPDTVLSALADFPESGDGSSRRFVAALAEYGIHPDNVPAVQLFADETPAGASESFIFQRDVICIVAAPGGAMQVHAQDPPTDLRVLIRRSRITESAEHPLPPPLADTRFEFRVANSTSEAYEVRAGEYIQVIDVAGRQCSDLLAFDALELQHGQECGLDATTTRTLMASAYPRPGLFSKLFDHRMQPMLEIVRDTVGRHDTFALACTAKYYEDLGYPGHVNCSENFNQSLSPYTIAPRKGWPALNLFYNTRIDCDNVLYMDEPWSRPGDYVLLRAMTDLVCLSSACPDDIDPANGWNPTDIHVRIYPSTNSFSRGVVYRMTPDADPQLTKETAFHTRTSALTRSFVEYRGYWLPTCFPGEGTIAEYYACRERAAVMDLSPLRKFEVLGPDAEVLLQSAVTRNVRRLSPGQIVYTAMCSKTGGLIDDGTIFRLEQNNFRWVCGCDTAGLRLRELAQERNLRVWVKSSTDQLHNLAVQGPRSREILKKILWTPPGRPSLEELTWFRFTVGRTGDMNGTPVLVSRTGYTGELGYEVWCHPKDALVVWDTVWEAGREFEMLPLGLDALDILRIESGLIFAGYEFDDQTDPFEAGIGFAVALKNDEDFIGREALLKRKTHPQRTLVGLELAGHEPAVHGDCVHDGRLQVGVITSGTRSPILKKNIALCRMAVEYADPGTRVEVGKLDGHQKRIAATVVPFPFYDPEKKRPRS